MGYFLIKPSLNARELLDTAPELRILEDVIGLEFVLRDTLYLEDLDGCTRKAALRDLRVTLHEQNDGGSSDGCLNF